jgi:hypothetical protein
LKNY